MVEKTIATPLRVKRGGRYLETKRSAPRTKNIAGSDGAPFKGVRMRAWGKWVTEIRDPLTKTRIWLGSFATAEMAARAYDAAVVCLKGFSAPEVNFPDAIPSFVIPQCNSSPKEIQAVALAAAAASVPAAAPLAMATTPQVKDSDSHDAASECSSSNVESWINNELCASEDQEAVVEPMRCQLSDSVEQAFLPWSAMVDENEVALDWLTNVPDTHLWSFS